MFPYLAEWFTNTSYPWSDERWGYLAVIVGVPGQETLISQFTDGQPRAMLYSGGSIHD